MSNNNSLLFQPRLIKEDDIYGKAGYTLNLVKPNVYQFYTRGPGCHVYLIIGENLNVLIDTKVRVCRQVTNQPGADIAAPSRNQDDVFAAFLVL